MRVLRVASSAVVLLSLAGCSTLPEGQKSTAPVTGPPEVEAATIESHALQFDEEEPLRPAGTQEELAASAYITAHVTQAGYVFRLDAVPVKDLVRSTNVVALPPGGAQPEVIVVTGYDSTESSEPNGHPIGVWLEVARALRVVDRDHGVQFVALGAEETALGGGNLGSRRLAQQLADDQRDPAIVVVGPVDAAGERVEVAGDAEDGVVAAASEAGVTARPARGPIAPESTGAVFAAAGFDTTVVSGGAEAVGRALLAYLSAL